MAQRRMFSQKIVGSDAFIEMPVSARELYFQLGMYADDDGFINPKKIIRMIGASEDDLKIISAKRFVLPFENGVVVIKHWKINNMIRKDFYEPTIYAEQLKSLELKENKAYTEGCQQNVNNLSPQYSIGKVSKDKNTAEKNSAIPFSFNEKLRLMEKDSDKRMNIIALYWKFKGFMFENQQQYSPAIKRELRPAANLLGYDIEKIKETMFWMNGQDWLDWTIETTSKYITKDLKTLKT